MPFVIKNPKTITAGTTSDAMIMNVDFAPTLLDMAGLEIPSEMQGKSFKGAFEGDDRPKKSVYYHYYEYPIWHSTTTLAVSKQIVINSCTSITQWMMGI